MFLILTEPLNNMKECVVNVTYGDNCNILLGVYEASDKGDRLETPPLGFIEDVDHYCYSVTTRNQNLSIIVEGVINLQHSSGTNGIQNLNGTYFGHEVYNDNCKRREYIL